MFEKPANIAEIRCALIGSGIADRIHKYLRNQGYGVSLDDCEFWVGVAAPRDLPHVVVEFARPHPRRNQSAMIRFYFNVGSNGEFTGGSHLSTRQLEIVRLLTTQRLVLS